MNGRTAQRIRERTFDMHPQKSSRVWQIRTQTVLAPGTALTQPSYTDTYSTINPVEEEVGEREAEYIGSNVLAGDVKLRLPGSLAITEKTVLTCDGLVVDIKKLDRWYHGGEVQEYRLYVAMKRSA